MSASDLDGWQLLVQLAENLGYSDMKTEFETAMEHEEQHLANVRKWLSESVMEEAQA